MTRSRRGAATRPSWFRRLTGSRLDHEARRRLELERRLRSLHRAARRPELPSDHRAFLAEALARLEAVREALPDEVARQALALGWQESLVDALERQAGGLPDGAAPFRHALPTTRAEEERRRRARAVLEAAGRRLRREREEVFALLEEVESGLEGQFAREQASPRPSPFASA
jgi:hypothetical protein